MMKLKCTKFLLCGAFLLPMWTSVVHATEPKVLGQHGDWTAYTFLENNNKVCYMVSQPKKTSGNYSKRGDIFALITHRPGEKSKNVFSYVSGYTYKTGSEASVAVNNQNFQLFTQDDSAWARDQGTDDKIIDAIKKGSSLVVKGVSARGTNTADTFGLSGSSAAYKAISSECGIK